MRLAAQLANGGELTARLIRQAAIELGVDGNPLLPSGGNDDVQTPPELAKAIVAHFMPCGRILEPSRGTGAFVKAIPGCDWCDLRAGKDFLAREALRAFSAVACAVVINVTALFDFADHHASAMPAAH